ncbi:LapA family protein [uncultured Paraglaciecola sp.]|uniref:LapA family protein n=1 Tax=uncultured Paraglaciecola sp. TaxID=1765024 RepID=UPI0030DCD335
MTYISITSVILVLVIVLQNMEIVTVDLLFWEISLPRAVLLSLTLLIGIVLGFIIHKGHRSSDK